MKKQKSSPQFIYITGCDGTGKTTQARLLLERLREKGLRVKHLWLRFPFFLSLPLLAYARLRGFSRIEIVEGMRYGYWDFERSRLLARVFPWALWLDASFAAFWKVALPLRLGFTLVCERFVLDMIADLSLALKDPNFCTQSPARRLLRLLPADACACFLDLDPATIRARRPDLVHDRRLEQRLQVYRRMGACFQIPIYSSLTPIEELNMQIQKEICDARG